MNNELPVLPGNSLEASQLNLLRNEAVDVKMAELERELRQQTKTLKDKIDKSNELSSELAAQKRAALKKFMKPAADKEARRILRGLKLLFEACSEADEMTIESLFGSKIKELSPSISTSRGDDEEIEGWWASIGLTSDLFGSYNGSVDKFVPFNPRAAGHSDVVKLSGQIAAESTERSILYKLRDEVKAKLDDFEFITRQVKAQVNVKIFEKLGIDLKDLKVDFPMIEAK